MKELAITIGHGLAGWALCRATMGIGMAATTFSQALVIHAIAAPLIFGGMCWFSVKWRAGALRK